MYCRSCGNLLPDHAVFCASCGTRKVLPVVSGSPGKSRRNLSKRQRLAVRLVIVAAVVFAAAMLAWQIGQMSGVWQRLALNRAATAWQRQDDRKEAEAEIFSTLEQTAAYLEQERFEDALTLIHPDQQEIYRNQFAAYPERIPALIHALRSARLTYLSDDLDAYELERMARVELLLPAAAGEQEDPAGSSFTMTLVINEGRWVIDS